MASIKDASGVDDPDQHRDGSFIEITVIHSSSLMERTYSRMGGRWSEDKRATVVYPTTNICRAHAP